MDDRAFRRMGTGLYHVTVSTDWRTCVFGEVRDNAMQLNEAGRMVQSYWKSLRTRFPGLEVDLFVVMPNYVRGILFLPRVALPSGRSVAAPGVTLNAVIDEFKMLTAHEYSLGLQGKRWLSLQGPVWEPGFSSKALVTFEEFTRTRAMVREYPSKWMREQATPQQTFDRS